MYAGTEIANDSRQELHPEAPSDFLPDGIMQLSSGNNKFPGTDSNPYRRVLIPATSKFIIPFDVFRSVIDSLFVKAGSSENNVWAAT